MASGSKHGRCCSQMDGNCVLVEIVKPVLSTQSITRNTEKSLGLRLVLNKGSLQRLRFETTVSHHSDKECNLKMSAGK